MMNRFQIKDIRFLLEGNGFFVEEVLDDKITAIHLKDKHENLCEVYPDKKCPECGTYLVYNTVTQEVICLNEDCLLYSSKMESTDLFKDLAWAESTLGLIEDDDE